MKLTRLAIAAMLLMTVHSALGQEERGPLPEPLVVVSSVLSLSEEQTHALVNMIEARNAAIQSIAPSLQETREALGHLLETPNPDPRVVGQLLIQVRLGEKEIAAVAQRSAAEFEAILTPEQHERLHFIRQATQLAPAIPAFKAVGLV